MRQVKQVQCKSLDYTKISSPSYRIMLDKKEQIKPNTLRQFNNLLLILKVFL